MFLPTRANCKSSGESPESFFFFPRSPLSGLGLIPLLPCCYFLQPRRVVDASVSSLINVFLALPSLALHILPGLYVSSLPRTSRGTSRWFVMSSKIRREDGFLVRRSWVGGSIMSCCFPLLPKMRNFFFVLTRFSQKLALYSIFLQLFQVQASSCRGSEIFFQTCHMLLVA